jgi:hypothetical protein
MKDKHQNIWFHVKHVSKYQVHVKDISKYLVHVKDDRHDSTLVGKQHK